MPKRIQRKRTRGWRMPPNTIYVGRPTKWGNPIRSHPFLSVVELYEYWLTHTPEGREVAQAARRELRGHDLACWCKLGETCHADVLLRIANANDEPAGSE